MDNATWKALCEKMVDIIQENETLKTDKKFWQDVAIERGSELSKLQKEMEELKKLEVQW